jgi:hypothetical protein
LDTHISRIRAGHDVRWSICSTINNNIGNPSIWGADVRRLRTLTAPAPDHTKNEGVGDASFDYGPHVPK